MAIEDFSDGPQEAEHEEDTYKGRKMGDALEDRNEDEATHTEEEDQLALGCSQQLGFRERGCGLHSLELTLQ